MTKQLRLWMFGAGEMASALLEELDSSREFDVTAVTPRRVGAGVPLNLSVFETVARERGVPIAPIENVNDPTFVETIRRRELDILINCGHHQLFGRPLLQSTKRGALNIHSGMLPLGRGSGGVVGEIWNGARAIGQTVHFMSDDFDTGRIVHQRTIPVRGDEYQNELSDKLFDGFVSFYLEGIRKVMAGERGTPIEGFGRYYPKMKSGDDIIDWNQTSEMILRKIRSRSPAILSRAYLEKDFREVFIVRASPSDVEPYHSACGQVLQRDEALGVLVKTGDSAVWIERMCDVPGGGEYIPRFPIGTGFVSNWIHEIVRLRSLLIRATG